ncbi:MAG: hypothetical protein ABSH06_32165 [Thermodesulfobacteriota bacterium]
MCKSKIVGMMALIAFAMGIFSVGDALAGERGKVAAREVLYATTVQTLKVPDVEGHTIHLIEAKGIGFSEKWGAYLIYLTYTLDVIKGEGTHQGYNHMTYPDGSTFTVKYEGKNMRGGRGLTGTAGGEGTWTLIKGTGKFEGIQGEGTYKSYSLGPGQWYNDTEGEYTLP